MFEWLLFRVKGLPLLNASCFAAFQYYEQDNTSRAREVAMKDLKDAKYQLKALLLRNNINYKGTVNWSQKHLRWLTELVLPPRSTSSYKSFYTQSLNE